MRQVYERRGKWIGHRPLFLPEAELGFKPLPHSETKDKAHLVRKTNEFDRAKVLKKSQIPSEVKTVPIEIF